MANLQNKSREKIIALLSQAQQHLPNREGTPTNRAGQGRILTSNRKDRLIFLEGAQFAACLFLRVSKNIPPNRMSERHTAVIFYCLYAVLFFIVSTFPSVACFRCRRPPLYRREREKVFGLNTLYLQRKILPETARPPDLFTFNGVCTNFHGRRGNRRPRNGHWLSWPESVRFLRLFSISLSISSEILSSVTLA